MEDYIKSKISYTEDQPYKNIAPEILKHYNGDVMNLKKEIFEDPVQKNLVIKTLLNLSHLLKNKNIDYESKLVITYYNILIEKDLFSQHYHIENLEILNHDEGIFSYYDPQKTLFNKRKIFMKLMFLFPDDQKLTELTNIKLKNIFFPEIILDKKTEHFNIVAIEKSSPLDLKKDNIIDVFLDILNILRQFEENNYTINFDSNMIQKIIRNNQKYCLIDFYTLKKFKVGDRKTNINFLKDTLEKLYGKKIKISNTENYSSIFYDLTNQTRYQYR